MNLKNPMTEATMRNQIYSIMDSTTVGVVIATFSVGSLVVLIWKFGYKREQRPNIVSPPKERKGSITNVNIAIRNAKPASSDGGSSVTKRKSHQNGCSTRVVEKPIPDLFGESGCNGGQYLTKSDNNNHLNVFPKPLTSTNSTSTTTSCISQKQAKLSRKLDEVNAQLDQLLLYKTNTETKLLNLQKELNEKSSQIHQYELANRSLSEKVQELESLLKTKETKIDLLLESKKRAEVESRNKIAVLETDRTTMNKALSEQTSRIREVLEQKNSLEKTVNDLKSTNQQQEEKIKKFERDRSTNDTQMKHALTDMGRELRTLQARLNATSELNEEAAKRDRQQVLEMAQREKELRREMRQLRKSLSALFPDIKIDDQNADGPNNNWVSSYVAAMKQLSGNVEDMLEDPQTRKELLSSPTKRSLWSAKSAISGSRSATPLKLGSTGGDSPRTGSPTSKSGRSSRGSSYYAEKRMAEARLVESLALFCLRCLD